MTEALDLCNFSTGACSEKGVVADILTANKKRNSSLCRLLKKKYFRRQNNEVF